MKISLKVDETQKPEFSIISFKFKWKVNHSLIQFTNRDRLILRSNLLMEKDLVLKQVVLNISVRFCLNSSSSYSSLLKVSSGDSKFV